MVAYGKGALVFCVAVAVFPLSASFGATWLDLDWRDRYELTMNNSASAENLGNFPVMVHLNAANFDFGRAQPQGQDVRFTDSDGTTLLSYEIEKWDAPNQQAWLWVNVPQVDAGSTDDNIYLYSQNPTAADGQDTTGTWNGDYHMVHHLQETSGTHFDSTSYANDGIWHEPIPDQPGTQDAVGKVAGANRFWGEDDWGDDPQNPQYLDNNNRVEIAADPSLHGHKSITVEAWVVREERVDWEDHFIRTGGEWMLNFPSGTSGDTVRFARLDKDWSKKVTSASVPDNEWHYLAGVTEFDGSGTTMSIYLDGQLSQSIYYPNASIEGEPTKAVQIGARGDLIGRSFFHGLIDEVRYSTAAASADWIEAQYLSMNDELLTFGQMLTAPEPGSLGLVALGGLTLLLVRRRRR
jgi:hypothetical protein